MAEKTEVRPMPDLWKEIAKNAATEEWASWEWPVREGAWAIQHYLGDLFEEGEDTEAFGVGAVIGFMMGQTVPSSIMDFKGWLAEAIRKGNLEEWAREQQIPIAERQRGG